MKIETCFFIIIGVMTLVIACYNLNQGVQFCDIALKTGNVEAANGTNVSLNFLLWFGVGTTELVVAYILEKGKITSLN